jgi:hypothetical protein
MKVPTTSTLLIGTLGPSSTTSTKGIWESHTMHIGLENNAR